METNKQVRWEGSGSHALVVTIIRRRRWERWGRWGGERDSLRGGIRIMLLRLVRVL